MPSGSARARAGSPASAHVGGAGRDAAGGCGVRAEHVAFVQHFLGAEAAEGTVEARVRLRAVRGAPALVIVGRGHAHPGRLQHALADEVFPAPAGHRLDQLAGDDVQQVVVGVAAAEAGCGPEEAQPPYRLGAAQRRARHEQQVARTQAQAAAVHEQIADGDLARHPGVVHLEAGQAVDDPVVPAELSLVDQHREHRDGERLAGRADREDGVGVDAFGRAEPAQAVAARQHDFAVLHDRHRHARHAVLAQQRLDARVQIRGRCGEDRTGERGQEHGERACCNMDRA